MTTTVHNVAAYILKACGMMTTMKLQKLVYYCQAWSLVWDEEPLFKEKIRAWINGPVVPELYSKHRGMFKVSSWESGNPDHLTVAQKETIDSVLSYYCKRSSHWLSELTHKESPWKDARKSLPPNARGNIEITHDSMFEYYDSLTDDEEV